MIPGIEVERFVAEGSGGDLRFDGALNAATRRGVPSGKNSLQRSACSQRKSSALSTISVGGGLDDCGDDAGWLMFVH